MLWHIVTTTRFFFFGLILLCGLVNHGITANSNTNPFNCKEITNDISQPSMKCQYMMRLAEIVSYQGYQVLSLSAQCTFGH